ncbi:MAG: sulfite exporter TauE/SafE family protein [Acidimicrobiales bacterium]|nr:sulfite exporter TauE/SafE family protein [Acidimicrobiales bacterium]
MTGAEIAVVVGASLIGAFIKSVTGMGYPLIAVPLITLVLGVEDAVVVVSAPNVVANFLLCAGARDGRHEARDLRPIVVFGMAGAVVGTFALVSVPEEPLLLALIATIVLFVVNYLRAPELPIDPATATRWSPAVGSVVGVMQGAVGVSGPVVAAWYHAYRLPKQTYVFTVTLVFGLAGLVQLLVILATGEYTLDRAVASAAAFLPVLATIPVGTALRARLGGRGFEQAVLAVLVASAAALVARVVL